MYTLKDINLVLTAGSEEVQEYLCELFAGYGADIIYCGFLDNELIDQIECNESIDVILIIIDNSFEEDDLVLERLLDKTDTVVLFYEHNFIENSDSGECGFSQSEIKKLVKKLLTLTEHHNKEVQSKTDSKVEIIPDNNSFDKESGKSDSNAKVNKSEAEQNDALSIKNVQKTKSEANDSNALSNIWVLGASLGGPQAVKRFLSTIPNGLPVAFVLAQHLGDGFVSLFASQLNKASPFSVKKGVNGDTLHHGEVILVPVDRQMLLEASGKIKLIDKKWQGYYRPSINSVIENVTRTFKSKSGVIIFSGMGSDGTEACQEFFDCHNGTIWVQSSDSCVISSMPDSICTAGLESYSGSPEALAHKLALQYSHIAGT